MKDHRKEAVELLQHYFAITAGKKSASELSNDARFEIAEIVDSIIAASKQQ